MKATRFLAAGCRLGDRLTFKPLVPPVLTERNRCLRCAHCFGNVVTDFPKDAIIHRFCSERCQAAPSHLSEEECVAKSLHDEMRRNSVDRKVTIGPTSLLLYRILRSIEAPNGDSHSSEETEVCFSALQSNLDASTSEEKDLFESVAQTVRLLIRHSPWRRKHESLGSRAALHSDDLADAVSKIFTNAFTICDGEGSALGLGLFPAAAVMNHSCQPNVFQCFDYGYNLTPELVLTTCKDVQSGEELCISYIDYLAPAHRRKEELRKGYKFECRCEKCETEHDDVALRCHSSRSSEDSKTINRVDALFSVIKSVSTSRVCSGSSTGPTEDENSKMHAAYDALKKLCLLKSWYVQEAGEAVIQSLLDSIDHSESGALNQQKCAKVLSILDELSNVGERVSPVNAMLRRYKAAKIKLFLYPDPRPALAELQEVHRFLVVFFPKKHELIIGLEECMSNSLR